MTFSDRKKKPIKYSDFNVSYLLLRYEIYPSVNPGQDIISFSQYFVVFYKMLHVPHAHFPQARNI